MENKTLKKSLKIAGVSASAVAVAFGGVVSSTNLKVDENLVLEQELDRNKIEFHMAGGPGDGGEDDYCPVNCG